MLRQNIVYNATSTNARGLIAPLIRASGHILFLLAALDHMEQNPTATPLMTEEEQINEFRHAQTHLDAENLPTLAILSEAARGRLIYLSTYVASAARNYETWTPEQRMDITREFANRIAGLGASLDRELAGVSAGESDAGTSL